VHTEYTYDPFGGTTTSGAATPNTFGFTGREAEGTGLYLCRARYYDPTRQRFVSEDPIGFEGGDVNVHAYLGNSATNGTDPTGEIAPWVAACLVGAALDAGWYAITDGRKSTLGGAGAAALRGCGAGVVGLGVGAALRGWRWLPNVGGIEKAWGPNFRTGWHRLPKRNFPGGGRNLPHYHRRPGIGKHKPWEGGW
jgi:RHS repeat-associated protein